MPGTEHLDPSPVCAVPGGDLPGCETGPAGRLRFILAELRELMRRLAGPRRGRREGR